MALPIGVTPKLTGREARAFHKKIAEGLRNPSTLIPTPKIEKAKILAQENAKKKRE